MGRRASASRRDGAREAVFGGLTHARKRRASRRPRMTAQLKAAVMLPAARPYHQSSHSIVCNPPFLCGLAKMVPAAEIPAAAAGP